MRVLVLVKSDPRTESGVLPSAEELQEMGTFNDELSKAGVMLAAEGLADSSQGKRVRFASAGTTVLDGPFTESKELVAGFWIWEVSSMEEAVEWLRRAPFRDTEVEIRRIFEEADLTGQDADRGQ